LRFQVFLIQAVKGTLDASWADTAKGHDVDMTCIAMMRTCWNLRRCDGLGK